MSRQINRASGVMARKPKFKLSKTKRIREHVRRLALFGVDDIDKFRQLVSEASVRRKRSFEKLMAEDDDFFAGETAELDTISRLTDELSIVALYRVVEIVTAKMLVHDLGAAVTPNKMYRINEVKKALRLHKNLELERVPYYGAMDKLRDLNNRIKHTDGRGLRGLDKEYDRLRLRIPIYIVRLAERMKLRYK